MLLMVCCEACDVLFMMCWFTAGRGPWEDPREHRVSEAPHTTSRQVPEDNEPNLKGWTHLQHASTAGECWVQI